MILRIRTKPFAIRRPTQRRQHNAGVTMMVLLVMQQILNIQRTHAIPYVLLKNKAPYCFSTDHMIQPHTTYSIDFHAPDMIVVDEIEDSSNANKDNLSYNNVVPPVNRNNSDMARDPINEHQQAIIDRGLDIRYQERQQKRYDILKRSNMKDVIITITPRDMMGGMIVPSAMRKKDIPESEIPIKYRHPLEQRSGSFSYYTGALNGGSLEICIQSYTANTDHPSRVAIRMENRSDRIELVMEQERERQLQLQKKEMEQQERQMQEQRLVMGESSRITAELIRLSRRAKGLNEDADYTKESESRFFSISLTFNKSIRNWYLVRVLVLLVTGYLQAKYIMKHMKSRNTYW